MKIVIIVCLIVLARAMIVGWRSRSVDGFLSGATAILPSILARTFVLYLPLAVLIFLLPTTRTGIFVVALVALVDWYYGFFLPKTDSTANFLPKQLIVNLFGLVGALCKADGRISEAEIKIAERYMLAHLQLNKAQQKIAIAAFREGAAKHDYQVRAKRLAYYFEDDMQAMLLALQMIREISFAGGYVDPRGQQMIQEICKIWGIEIPSRDESRSEQAHRTTSEEEWERPHTKAHDPFAYFGCTSQSTAKELKGRYRELCKKYHPDRLRAKAFHADYLKQAEERFKEIQKHWEEVGKIRPDLA